VEPLKISKRIELEYERGKVFFVKPLGGIWTRMFGWQRD